MPSIDKKFLDWLTYQPSCIDGAFNQYLDGEGRNIACHVRRAGKAGTGYKPKLSAVPMTDFQHKMQSIKGEAYLLNHYFAEEYDVQSAKEWFDRQVIKYLSQFKRENEL